MQRSTSARFGASAFGALSEKIHGLLFEHELGRPVQQDEETHS